MARRNLKIEEIINSAKMRADAALAEVKAHEWALELAHATYQALADSYDDLKHALAPTSRQLANETKKKVTTNTAKGGCSECIWLKGDPIHTNSTYDDYREYEPKRGSKSNRSPSAMAETIAKGLKERREESEDYNDSLCIYTLRGGGRCSREQDHNIHHKTTDSLYHPFVPPAQPAASQSSTNGAGSGSIRNSETEREGVSSAVHAQS